MAILSGVGESYTASGASGVGLSNREDLADFITNISPVDCPFTSSLGKTTATGVIHEWLTHSLAAASATNVAIEGNESTFSTPTLRRELTYIGGASHCFSTQHSYRFSSMARRSKMSTPWAMDSTTAISTAMSLAKLW